MQGYKSQINIRNAIIIMVSISLFALIAIVFLEEDLVMKVPDWIKWILFVCVFAVLFCVVIYQCIFFQPNSEVVIIKDKVQYITSGNRNFKDVKIVILDKYFEFTEAVFVGAKDVETIYLPETIEVIPDYSFFGCESLKSIVIPKEVTKIGSYAFTGCESLETIDMTRLTAPPELGESPFPEKVNIKHCGWKKDSFTTKTWTENELKMLNPDLQ